MLKKPSTWTFVCLHVETLLWIASIYEYNELAHCKNVNKGKHAKDNLSILEIELNFNK